MSTLIEDPTLPLVGYSDTRHRTLSINSRERIEKPNQKKSNPHVGNVGLRLASRMELNSKRKRICDAQLCMAIIGIVIMIVETELTETDIIKRSGNISIVLKSFITASTVTLVVLIAVYYKLSVELFMVDNSLESWRLTIRSSAIVYFLIEIAICLVHPIPGDYNFTWSSPEQVNHGSEPIKVPLDVILSLPMFFRLYLICRFMMLHSRLYQDASCQSLGAVSGTKFNFRFIFKSFMALYPAYFLSTFIVSLFAIASWSLRLCEQYNNNDPLERVHGNLLNSMWIIATLLTSGYADLVPDTHCGRSIGVLTGMIGTGCTALIIAVLASKLELSHSEKYVHNFVLEIDLAQKLEVQAANVVKHGWKLNKLKKINDKTREDEKRILKMQAKFFNAIYNTRKLRSKRSQMTDVSVILVEVSKSQVEMHRNLANACDRQIALEERMNRVENMVLQMHEKICGQ